MRRRLYSGWVVWPILCIFNSMRKIIRPLPSHDNCTRGPKNGHTKPQHKLSLSVRKWSEPLYNSWHGICSLLGILPRIFSCQSISALYFGYIPFGFQPKLRSGDYVPGTTTIISLVKHSVKKKQCNIASKKTSNFRQSARQGSISPIIFIIQYHKYPYKFGHKSKTIIEF